MQGMRREIHLDRCSEKSILSDWLVSSRTSFLQEFSSFSRILQTPVPKSTCPRIPCACHWELGVASENTFGLSTSTHRFSKRSKHFKSFYRKQIEQEQFRKCRLFTESGRPKNQKYYYLGLFTFLKYFIVGVANFSSGKEQPPYF